MNCDDNDDIDLIFSVQGAPNRTFLPLLTGVNKDKYGLLSIEPSFIADINKKYGLNLRITNFRASNFEEGENSYNAKSVYEGMGEVSTIGTYAFLIASKNVRQADQFRFVSQLYNSVEDIKGIQSKDLDIRFSSFPLNELAYFESEEDEYGQHNLILIRETVVFLASMTIGTLIIFRIFTLLLSFWVQRKYVRVLAEVQSDLRSGYEKDRAINPVEYLKFRIERLFESEDDIYRDFNNGEITGDSHSMLVESLDRLKARARQQVFEYLSKNIKEIEIGRDEISALMRGGYIDREQEERLLSDVKA
jgi:hypothetical protein